MPTYQYACADCQEQLEVVQSFSDASLTECPTCGGRLRKKFGAVGVVFKGSGFYKTDSRSSSSSEGSKGSSGDSAPKTDSAPKKDAAPAASSSSSSSSASSSTSSTPAA